MSIHTKTAIEAVKRSPFQAFSAIFVTSLTFFIASFVAVLVYASNQALNFFETRPQIIAFLKDSAKESDISGLKSKLERDIRIRDLKFVSKEEALNIYKEATADNPLLSELVNPSIFPASLEFSVVELDLASTVIEEVKKEPAVDQVGFTANLGSEKTLNDVVSRLKMVANYLRYGGLAFVLVLGMVSFVVLTVIITMRMIARRNEVEILSLIGAKPSFIRSPIMFEAIIYVVSGVFIGWVSSFIIWLYFAPSAIKYFGQIPILPKDPVMFFAMFLIILLGEIFLGLTMAFLGSLIAVNRVLKKLK